MDLLISDPAVSRRLIRQRRARGIDKRDEVWEGVYIVSPPPDDDHQDLSDMIGYALQTSVRFAGLGLVRTGAGCQRSRGEVDQEFSMSRSRRLPQRDDGHQQENPLARRPRLRRRDHQPPRPLATEARLLCERRRERVAPCGPQTLGAGTLSAPGWGSRPGRQVRPRPSGDPRQRGRTADVPTRRGRPSAEDRDRPFRRRPAMVGLRLGVTLSLRESPSWKP